MKGKKNKKKKGISELFSFVLLTALVIAMGAFVISWLIPYIQRQSVGETELRDVYCDDVQIDVNNICKGGAGGATDPYYIKFNVQNKGLFSITRLTLGRETELDPLRSCRILNLDIAPQTQITEKIYIGGHLNAYTIIECRNIAAELPQAVSTTKIKQITLTPWIEAESQSIPCEDKKISVDENILMNPPQCAT